MAWVAADALASTRFPEAEVSALRKAGMGFAVIAWGIAWGMSGFAARGGAQSSAEAAKAVLSYPQHVPPDLPGPQRRALLVATPAMATTAGADPFSRGLRRMRRLFNQRIAGAFSIICVIVAGVTWAFGEGQAKGRLAGLIFGVGMALAAVPFLNWITPTGTTVGAATLDQAATDAGP